ncbi:MAG TPA: imidazolonepropionase, partial [Hellea balneolensis]|nr:imidazolonepropionase [Hellea balneolensis]
MKLRFDTIFINANLATMDTNVPAPYGMIKNAALGVAGGKITWLGPQSDLPAHKAEKKHDCEGGWITPGLVDCHTHLVFAGNRAREFELRLEGAS